MTTTQVPGIRSSGRGLKTEIDRELRVNRPSIFRPTVTALLLFCTSLSFFLFRINRPKKLYFDEAIYVGLARKLLQGNLGPMPQQFSEASVGRQHPPLGAYLIAAGIKTAGDNPLGWRLASAFSGALTLAAIFFWTYLLLGDYRVALSAAVLTLFNNFLYVMSRMAMLDVFVFMFCIWGVLAFTLAIKLEISTMLRRGMLLTAGLLFGLAGACKWNAIDTLAGICAISLLGILCGAYIRRRYEALRDSVDNLHTIGLPTVLLAFFVAPVVSYTATFFPLFHAMHQPFSLAAFIRMHRFMLELTKDAPGVLLLYVPWYRWPFRLTPNPAMSYLLGNPAVMWAGAFAVLACAARLWKRLTLPEGMVVCLYAANFLQWVVTPLKVPNYYYYYSAAMFLGPALAIVLNHPTQKTLFGIRLNLILLVVTFAVFLYCYQRMGNFEAPWDCALGCWV